MSTVRIREPATRSSCRSLWQARSVTEGSAGDSADDWAFLAALIAEAMRKTDICWVRLADGGDADGRDRPVWHVWHDDAAYVVSGGEEQPLPGVESASRAVVTCRTKDSRARLVSWLAEISTVAPGTPEWEVAAGLLQADRLNLVDPDSVARRWAEGCTITRLTPLGSAVEAPGRFDDNAGAAPPPPTRATTRSGLPRVLHRRQRRRPRLG
jgi:hypothetical protein